MIVMSLGGRAAEEIVFGDVTTGAANDIEKATGYARSMITMYGMSDHFGLMQLESIESQYLDRRRVMNCADSTAAEVDDEVRRMLSKAYEQAKAMLLENREILDKLAAHLIEKETITGEEFMRIYRAYKEEIEQKKAAEASENIRIDAEEPQQMPENTDSGAGPLSPDFWQSDISGNTEN